MTSKTEKRWSYAILVGPAVLIYATVILFPIIFSFSLSFTRWSGFGTPEWIGLGNYTRMMVDPVFRIGLRNNLLIVVVSVFGQIPFGFILAYIVYRKIVGGHQFFETMIFLPITVSAIVVAKLWNQIFSPAGVVTQLVRIVQDNPRYVFSIFENRDFAIVPILGVILWYYTGIYMVIFLANLNKISPDVIEASVMDGAKEHQILFRVILPQMTNIVFTTAVFAIAGSLKSFDLVFAMTGGGPAHYTEVIAIYMYFNTFRYYNYGYGSAISIMIVFLSLGMISVLMTISRRFERKYE
ncbi:multiple sugar transport system permease protein/raffinose/stachyose/melibiose transport system permease protein [Alkalispirochaeta americana]|uniref:Multiple sugar transport system permease protein/raffinose/stachyose/melibiose transport system permease protein n=1 Tax=Alkalispirochaeta americana TaxID=159291 RepID=A0A1N6VU67_9SPIO|nr:sugar ABC transporter permease [Alkalispirochaeta americana]SIQ81407.1 multiple sugar transport system permease protein/raffinose/stachyose/melibiose transport system permease protein [Alkalispirochaeta americana]